MHTETTLTLKYEMITWCRCLCKLPFICLLCCYSCSCEDPLISYFLSFSLWLCTVEIVIFQSALTAQSLSITCWENFGSFLGIAILASFTALVVFKASLMFVSESKSHRNSFDIFTEALRLSYTTFGFNVFYYNRYWRTYTDTDKVCSNFIRDVKLFPQETRGLIDEI